MPGKGIDDIERYPFMNGSGEMAQLCRAFDWTNSIVGEPISWPAHLKATVSMLLDSSISMFLWWGDEFVQIYNDAFRRSLGENRNHPSAFGSSGHRILISSLPVLFPLVVEVKRTGVGVLRENEPYSIVRMNRSEERFCTLSHSPVRDESGAVSGVLTVCFETASNSGQNSALQSDKVVRLLQSENAELKSSNDRLRQFAYVAAHDLQEPLRKSNLFLKMLTESLGSVDAASENLLHRLRNSVNRMSSLVLDVLIYSQTTAGQVQLVPIDITEILSEVLTDFELKIIELAAEISAGPLPTVIGNRLQINQLFTNLISNSLKFVKEGESPKLSITCMPGDIPAPSSGAARRVKVVFSDQGIGFDQIDAEKIFDVFHRLNPVTAFAGNGIGLAMCRQIARNHGGDITAVSIPGQGATFTIDLTLA